MLTLTTPRLTLKPLNSTYLSSVHEYASDIENTRYMERLPNESIEETKAFLQRTEEEWTRKEPSFYEFAVLYQGKQIGAVSIYREGENECEMGWIIHKNYWRQGFAYEAASALMEYSIQKLHIKHFVAHCDAANTASYKVMEKLGMTRTDTYGGRNNKAASEESTEYKYERFL